MLKSVTIIKRKGKKQKFDEKKVYESCYSACLSSQIKPTEAKKLCEKVSKQIKNWAKGKKEITSDEISKETASVLKKLNKDVALMYETHRDIG